MINPDTIPMPIALIIAAILGGILILQTWKANRP